MALTRHFKETVLERVECDDAFAQALLNEAVILTVKPSRENLIEIPHVPRTSEERQELPLLPSDVNSGMANSLLEFMRASPLYPLEDVEFERNKSLTCELTQGVLRKDV